MRILLVLVSLCALVPRAYAQDDADARSAFEAGREAYEHGQFERALEQFERAYALSPKPQLLFNIGRAADSDGQPERAVSAYEGYLGAHPEADNAEFVRARLAKLRREDKPVVVPRVQDAPPPEKRRSLMPAAIMLAAVGVVSAGLFVGYAIAARNGYDQCDGPRFCSDNEFADEHRKKVYIADGFAAAAVATGVTASVLFFVQRSRDKRAPVDVSVALAPTESKVVLHGSF
ncbi:MAG: tetratricopeptide repeat protein [Polyangiales bacterium]